MMIAKMFLFVCVSSDRKLKVAFDQIGTTEDNEAFQVEVNSAGFVPFSTHAAKVSAHNSFIEERDRAKTKEEGDRATKAGQPLSQAEAMKFVPIIGVNLMRALNGGSPPDLSAFRSEGAVQLVHFVTATNGPLNGQLYKDSYSKQVITKYGPSIFDGMCQKPGMLPFMYVTNLLVALRTRFLDNAINEAIRAGVEQIVYLGMGLDTRALRLQCPGVRVYEVDFEQVFRLKSEALPEESADAYAGAAKSLAADYLADPTVISTLEELDDGPLDHAQGVLFVWESRAVYTEKEVMIKLFKFIFQEFPKARIVFDTMDPDIEKSELLKNIEAAISEPPQHIFKNTIDLSTFADTSGVTIASTRSCEQYAKQVFRVVSFTNSSIGVIAQEKGYLPVGLPERPERLADDVLKNLHFNILVAPMYLMRAFNGETLSMGPAFGVNLMRALNGGDPPKLSALDVNAAKLVERIKAITNTLYKDSYSKQVITPPAEILFNRMCSGILDFMYVTNLIVAVRTHFIDHQIRKAISAGVEQIVYLGMGLDTRALRLKRTGVSVYEVDFDDVLNTKLQALPEEYAYADAAESLAADYLADPTIIDTLQGLDHAQGVLFVWESRSMYTEEDVMIKLFEYISQNFQEATIVFDMVDTEMGGSGFLDEIERRVGKVFKKLKDIGNIKHGLGEMGLTLETDTCLAYAGTIMDELALKKYLPDDEALGLAKHVLEHMHFNVAIQDLLD